MIFLSFQIFSSLIKMATSHINEDTTLCMCSICSGHLSMSSKSLPCLHSLCETCFKDFRAKTKGEIGQCPVCYVSAEIGRMTLSPSITKTLRRQKLQTTTTAWKCDGCSKEGTKSLAKIWCDQCHKLLCHNCEREHNKWLAGHKTIVLDAKDRDKLIDLMTEDLCHLHLKNKETFCLGCNLCFCDTCYKRHLSADCCGCASSQPLSVREEAKRRKTNEGPVIMKDMDEFHLYLKKSIEKTEKYREDFSEMSNSERVKIWNEYEEIIENIREDRSKLMDELDRVTKQQVYKYNDLMEEKKRLLKQIEIIKVNLEHLLLNECPPQDVLDITCGLRTLGSKLSSLRLPGGEGETTSETLGQGKCQLRVSLSDWWPQLLEKLKQERIGSVSLTFDGLSPSNRISIHNEWIIQGFNQQRRKDMWITSMIVSEDNHIFFCDLNNQSIIEFTEEGGLVGECLLREGKGAGGRDLLPMDICSISSDSFVVVAEEGSGSGRNETLIFFERKKVFPFFHIQKTIQTGRKTSFTYFHSLFERNGEIIICDLNLEIISFTKEGKKIKTIKTRESGGPFYDPLIRADPSNGNFWLVKRKGFSSSFFELFCFDGKGKKIHSIKIEEEISDFCLNEFGNFFCNLEGIFPFIPKKNYFINLRKNLNLDREFPFQEINYLFILELMEKI